MADSGPSPSHPTSLPHRPASPSSAPASANTNTPATSSNSNAATTSDAAGPPSKSALKKAAKEKEKAEKAAKRAAQEQERKAAVDASDTSKDSYGPLPDGLQPRHPVASVGDQTSRTITDNAPPQSVTLRQLAELDPTGDASRVENSESTIDAESLFNKPVRLRARVQNARVQSTKLAFLDLRQRGENIQAVIGHTGAEGPSKQMVKWCGSLPRESIVLITGLVQKPRDPVHSASISGLEIHITACFVVSEGPTQLPIQVKDAMRPPPAGDETGGDEVEGGKDESENPIVTLNSRLNNRCLSLRTPADQAIFAINGAVCMLYREFMLERQFQELQTPKIAGAATEGGSNVFAVNYFNSPAFLTQSPQFYKQMAISGDLERVFEIGPVFRAENSNTPRHLTEFTGLDFEMEIQHDWSEVVDMAEDLIVHIFHGLRSRCAYWMNMVQREYPDAGNFKIPGGRAPRLRFAEGIRMLREAGIEARDDEDISTPHEKALGKLIAEKYDTDFYILTHYPVSARPFYTHLAPGEPHLTHSYDAFMRGQEVVSGAQRIHDPTVLAQRMRAQDPPLNPEAEGFRYYVDAFRMGCAPHGGGGFGLNRITMLWLGLANIRQATLFPRDPQRKAP